MIRLLISGNMISSLIFSNSHKKIFIALNMCFHILRSKILPKLIENIKFIKFWSTLKELLKKRKKEIKYQEIFLL